MTEEKNEVYKNAFDIACSNRVLSFNDPVIDALFKAVKKTLGNDVISRIEHSKRDKVILIPSNDNELAKGIVSYIWYIHPPKLVSGETGYKTYRESLRHRDYLGWTEEQLVSDIGRWGLSLKEVFLGTHDHKYKWDYIQFLQNIKGKYQEVLKRLLALSRIPGGFELGNERMLIVSTDKVDTLPQGLKDQFEILIELEPEKKVIPASTIENKSVEKQGNVFRWAGGTWEITFDGKTIRPADSKGLRYIHYLMHHSSKKISVLELVQIGVSSEKAKQSLIEKGKHAEIKGLNESGSEDDSEGDEPIDKLSIKKNGEDVVADTLSVEEYKRCLFYLKEQEESEKLSGDVAKLKKTQEQIDQIEKILKTSHNKKGLPRKFVGEPEKIRIAVYKCIKSSLDMIQNEHPSFYEHLKPPTISTGVNCSYTPIKEIPCILV